MTRWEALKEIFSSNDCQNKIGCAWRLYFYLIFNGDEKNKFVTNYPELKRELGAPEVTIKKWKERLIEMGIIKCITGKYRVTLILLPPYDTPLTCLKTDMTEIQLKSDPATKKLLTKLFSTNNFSLLPMIADLAYKIELLEKRTAGKNCLDSQL